MGAAIAKSKKHFWVNTHQFSDYSDTLCINFFTYKYNYSSSNKHFLHLILAEARFSICPIPYNYGENPCSRMNPPVWGWKAFRSRLTPTTCTETQDMGQPGKSILTNKGCWFRCQLHWPFHLHSEGDDRAQNPSPLSPSTAKLHMLHAVFPRHNLCYHFLQTRKAFTSCCFFTGPNQ